MDNTEKKTGEDFILIKAFLAGDNSAFDNLVLNYQNRVFNTCFRILGNYEDANDSAQDVFVKVFRSLKKFRFRASFSTWIYRIAINTCRNKLRSAGYRRQRNTIRFDQPADQEEGSYSMEIGDDTRTPEKELTRKEKGILIQKAIDSLPESQKAIVVLRDIDGFTYEEIASITGLNPGTVKSKLARARKKLRDKLSTIHVLK
jgi:RNA polymerase sigma-70 factor, ECF subfamily